MTEKRRNGNEASQTRAAATSAAEAAAFGTAAGAIVLGVTEAQARQKDADTAEAVHDFGRTVADTLAVQDAAAAISDQYDGKAPPPNIDAVGEPEGGPSGVTRDTAQRTTTAGDRAEDPAASEMAASEAARNGSGGSDVSPTEEAGTSPAEVAPEAESAIPGDRGAISGSAGSGPTPLSPVDPAALSERIAGEITAAVGKITQGIADGLAPDEIGTSVAEQVRDTVSLITKDIETALSGVSEHAQGLTGGLTQGLSDGIETKVADALAPVTDIAQPAIETVPSLAGGVAGQVGGIVETELAPSLNLKEVADIPASLLGAESASDLPGGILSDIFYSDGAAEASGMATADPPAFAPVAAPVVDVLSGAGDVLSEAAASTVDATGDLPLIDFAGVSYSDTPDSAYGGMTSGLNALHLL